jgi:hypothetical protein
MGVIFMPTNKTYDNLEKMIFSGVGEYGIPEIMPEEYKPCEWIGFNYAANTTKRAGKGVHFFLDDYQFERVWNNPDRYIEVLRDYEYVLSPDFSMYIDFPKAMQIYNHYRKHWCAAYMQMNGLRVIPTIAWSDESSFEWCFDGEPVGSVVAVSSVGTQNSKAKKAAFLRGYETIITGARDLLRESSGRSGWERGKGRSVPGEIQEGGNVDGGAWK